MQSARSAVAGCRRHPGQQRSSSTRPGSTKGCVEQLDAVIDVLPHALRLLHDTETSHSTLHCCRSRPRISVCVTLRLGRPKRICNANRRGGSLASAVMLRLVLPKGSLEKATLDLFEAADLPVSPLVDASTTRRPSTTRGSSRCASCGRRRSRCTSPKGCSTSASPVVTGSRRPAASSRASAS